MHIRTVHDRHVTEGGFRWFRFIPHQYKEVSPTRGAATLEATPGATPCDSRGVGVHGARVAALRRDTPSGNGNPRASVWGGLVHTGARHPHARGQSIRHRRRHLGWPGNTAVYAP